MNNPKLLNLTKSSGFLKFLSHMNRETTFLKIQIFTEMKIRSMNAKKATIRRRLPTTIEDQNAANFHKTFHFVNISYIPHYAHT